MIGELTEKDDCFVDKNGVHWDTIEDYICIEYLDTCGCGSPAENATYIRDMLQRNVGKDSWNHVKYDNFPVMFFLYWADHKGFIEHGTTVRCSWLTDKGKELLKILNELFPGDTRP